MEPNHDVKNRFDSKTNAEKLEILRRYVDKYKGGSNEFLIEFAIQYNVVGELVNNSNYRF